MGYVEGNEPCGLLFLNLRSNLREHKARFRYSKAADNVFHPLEIPNDKSKSIHKISTAVINLCDRIIDKISKDREWKIVPHMLQELDKLSNEYRLLQRSCGVTDE